MHIYSNNDDTDKMNTYKLKQFAKAHKQPVALLRATNTPPEAELIKNKEFRYIQNKMLICREAKIMLRFNLSKQSNLVNGSQGVVKELVYLDNSGSENPSYIFVFFPQYCGPQFFSDAERLHRIHKLSFNLFYGPLKY